MTLVQFIKKLVMLDVIWGKRSKLVSGCKDGGAKATEIANTNIAKEWNGNTIYNLNHPANLPIHGGHFHDIGSFTIPDPERVVLYFDCNSSLVVGDLVRESLTDDDKVLKVTNNTSGPAIGVVMEKTTATTCKVMIIGKVSGQTGLVRGRKVFVSPSGVATAASPSSNYMQVLGIAISATEYYLKPEFIRVKRA